VGTAAAAKVLTRLRALCLGLPDTAEVEAWGHPTFRVGVGKQQKIFCACGADGEVASIGWKCEPEVQHALVASDPRFTIAAYVGKHGWVSFAATGKLDWGFLAEAIKESYRLVAKAKAKPKPKPKPAKKRRTKRRPRRPT
jgi:predicted DNA-binding protein (MmcQ/YjbR family)